EDLARWGKALYEGRAFDAALLSEMLDGVPARLGPNTRYGLGVIIRETPLGSVWGHSGFFPGYLAELLYLPDAKVAVAFQVNTSVSRTLGRSAARVAMDVAERVVSEVNR
ncbi:MAG TPA: serine hydrolase, partial [Gemmatimonadaceae bacterium]